MPPVKKKKALILYDGVYRWWKNRLAANSEFDKRYDSVKWAVYNGCLPKKTDSFSLLVVVPEHSNGTICQFKKHNTLTIQEIVDDAVRKGWDRIHIHSCLTSTQFRNLSINTDKRVVVTGFDNEISAEKKQKTSTADRYLISGCPQSTRDPKILPLVGYCIFWKRKIYCGKLIKIKK
jgi:hypothetical protein